jgi:hypothetical protein
MDSDEPSPLRPKGAPEPVTRTRRWVIRVGVAVVAIVSFFGITAVTGFPGPGPLRRYPRRDLERLSDKINEHGERWACDATDPPTARVDPIRGRVVIDWHGHAPASRFAPEDQEMIEPDQQMVSLQCALS